jgi:hypothetical protein
MHKLQICCTHVLASIDGPAMGYGGFAASAHREFVAGGSKNVRAMDRGQWKIDNEGLFETVHFRLPLSIAENEKSIFCIRVHPRPSAVKKNLNRGWARITRMKCNRKSSGSSRGAPREEPAWVRNFYSLPANDL